MRTFVLTKGRLSRFWNIHLQDGSLVVSTGTTGLVEVEELDHDEPTDPAEEFERLVADKLAEGYVETTNDPWHGGYTSDLRTALEDSIAEEPDDLGTHMAYADHLIDLGDPRGEFIQVQLALEDESLPSKERQKLRRREKALLAQHERTWLGLASGYCLDKIDGLDSDWWYVSGDPHDISWRRGWIDSLCLRDGDGGGAEAIASRAPLFRCLRDFRILFADVDNDSGPSILRDSLHFGHVRIFQVGNPANTQNYFSGEIDLAGFVERMPRLEQLHCYHGVGPDWFFTQKYPPTLRRLTIHHGWGFYRLGQLLANETLHNLTHLSCWPRSQSNYIPSERNNDGTTGYISRSDAVELFRSKKLPHLRHLCLRNSDIGDEGVRQLIESGFLKQLRSLDLLGGCVTNEGARLLAGCADARKLESLNLGSNVIGDEGLEALRSAGVRVTAERQWGEPALDTRRYLNTGDCE